MSRKHYALLRRVYRVDARTHYERLFGKYMAKSHSLICKIEAMQERIKKYC